MSLWREKVFGGIEVEFPFTPYPCQVEYMRRVLQCLENGWNSALESPTGTGKTLCLLCATLAWQKHRKLQQQTGIEQPSQSHNNSPSTSTGTFISPVPRVYYASRTHSQLAQVVKELNKTSYKSVTMTVLGSRDQLCLDGQVQRETNMNVKNHICRAKVATRTCHYYNDYEGKAKLYKHKYESGTALDIEDLMKIGTQAKVCPYYKSRDTVDNADLVLLPYNYLMDSRARKANKVNISGAILIFDEAHNIEKICEDSFSITIRSRDISGCIKEMKTVLEMVIKEEEQFRTEMDNTDVGFGKAKSAGDEPTKLLEKNDIAHLLLLLQELETTIDKLDISDKSSESRPVESGGRVFVGAKMLEILESVGFTMDMKDAVVSLIDKVGQYLAEKETNLSIGLRSFQSIAMQNFANFLSTVFGEAEDKVAQTPKATNDAAFSLYVTNDEQPTTVYGSDGQQRFVKNAGKPGLALNYWCFSASPAMRRLIAFGTRCVILTSGTLSPLSQYVKDLGIPVQCVLENDHVIRSSQVLVAALTKGTDSEPLVSNFRNRSNMAYVDSLGNTLVNICRTVPQGALLFFSSYAMMNLCLERWQDTACGGARIYERLSAFKRVFVEPRQKADFQRTIRDFDAAVTAPDQTNGNNGGALFIAICRGKLSEGIDFADRHGRAVIIVGIPFSPLKDARVCLKKDYLGRMFSQNKCGLSPQVWYELEATRAVNQAIGRVIRHQTDFGAVILADNRFAQWPASKFPKWLRNSVKVYENAGPMLKELSQFYQSHGLVNSRRTGITDLRPSISMPGSGVTSLGCDLINYDRLREVQEKWKKEEQMRKSRRGRWQGPEDEGGSDEDEGEFLSGLVSSYGDPKTSTQVAGGFGDSLGSNKRPPVPQRSALTMLESESDKNSTQSSSAATARSFTAPNRKKPRVDIRTFFDKPSRNKIKLKPNAPAKVSPQKTVTVAPKAVNPPPKAASGPPKTERKSVNGHQMVIMLRSTLPPDVYAGVYHAMLDYKNTLDIAALCCKLKAHLLPKFRHILKELTVVVRDDDHMAKFKESCGID